MAKPSVNPGCKQAPPGRAEGITPWVLPGYNLRHDYPPTLLLHGDLDTDAPHRLSTEMAEKLSARGIQNQMITVHGKGHVLTGIWEATNVYGLFPR
ncbi:MAG: prolyl oligopeptidase family serine peptidase [Bacillota bacterium]